MDDRIQGLVTPTLHNRTREELFPRTPPIRRSRTTAVFPVWFCSRAFLAFRLMPNS